MSLCLSVFLPTDQPLTRQQAIPLFYPYGEVHPPLDTYCPLPLPSRDLPHTFVRKRVTSPYRIDTAAWQRFWRSFPGTECRNLYFLFSLWGGLRSVSLSFLWQQNLIGSISQRGEAVNLCYRASFTLIRRLSTALKPIASTLWP
uniref:Uncharacterized protein n=1 Tax=Schistocephalus solidus TaxID=70667 RepID=A0A0X3P0J3_SCHSO